MKKYILILVAMVCFGMSANAQKTQMSNSSCKTFTRDAIGHLSVGTLSGGTILYFDSGHDYCHGFNVECMIRDYNLDEWVRFVSVEKMMSEVRWMVEKSLADNEGWCKSELNFWGKTTEYSGNVGKKTIWITVVDKNYAQK